MRTGLPLAALAAPAALAVGPATSAAVQDAPAAQARAREGIEARHPSQMFDLAEALFATEEGKEEGVFWYCAARSPI